MSHPDPLQPPAWFTSALAAQVRTLACRLPDGRALALRSWGNGPQLIVLVHGGGAHARWWDHIGPLLVRPGETVAAVDLAGHGSSDWLTGASGRAATAGCYDLPLWAGDLVELMAALAPAATAPPILVGHSMGGLVAWMTAARPDAQLGGVIAVDSPIGDVELAASSPVRPVRPHRIFTTRAEILARFRTLPDQELTLPYVMAHLARTSITAVAGGWRWRHDPAVLHHAFATSAAPERDRVRLALLLAEQTIVRPVTLRYLDDTMGDSIEIGTMPRTGHHAMLDQPHVLVAAVRAILDAWNSPATRALDAPKQ